MTFSIVQGVYIHAMICDNLEIKVACDLCSVITFHTSDLSELYFYIDELEGVTLRVYLNTAYFARN